MPALGCDWKCQGAQRSNAPRLVQRRDLLRLLVITGASALFGLLYSIMLAEGIWFGLLNGLLNGLSIGLLVLRPALI